MKVGGEDSDELDHKVVALLNKTVDTFSKIVRTDIMHDNHQDPGGLTDAELLDQMEAARRALGAGDVEVE